MTPLDGSMLSASSWAHIDARLATARAEQPAQWQTILSDERVAKTLRFVFHCSEFVAAACLQNPRLLLDLIGSGNLFATVDVATLRAQLSGATGQAESDAELLAGLRQFRQLQMVRIAWRDLTRWADLRETLGDLSNLADVCIEFAYAHAYREFAQRHGVPYGARSGEQQALVVLGMGKLG